jgi:thiol-disulfide isomerase/thioredoxin
MMKRLAIVFLWLTATTASEAQNVFLQVRPNAVVAIPPADSAAGLDHPETLRWRNGEILPGEVVAASGTAVTWKSPLFDDPLLLDWRVLDRIEHSLPPVAPADSFAFSLRDGSHLYGELVAVNDTTISIHSSRHGDVTLDRSEVLNIRRIKGSGLIFAGPSGDVGWKELPAEGNTNRASLPAGVSPLITGPGGALLMPYWNRTVASLPLAFPERVNVEFCVRSSKRPDFQLLLDDGTKNSLRVETWGDTLVLTAGDQFKTIRKLAAGERDVSLRVCWDTPTRHCAVFSPEGELLAEWVAPENSTKGHSGLTLANKGRDLSLESLRVRPWDGQPPPKVDVRQPRVELADGRTVVGEISGGSAESIAFPAGVPDLLELATGFPRDETKFPLGQVDEIVFSNDLPQFSQAQPTLSYADATMLMGRLSAVKAGQEAQAVLETSFTQTPLASSLDGVRRIINKVPAGAGAAAEPPLASLDEIVLDGHTLHGRFISAGDDQPRWLPVGGTEPARPVKNLSCEITRSFALNTQFAKTPALFYTRAGDVLPGRLLAIDDSGAEFESGIVELRKLPAADLAAVQFPGAEPGVNLHGFNDPEWRILRGDSESVQRTDRTLKMEPNTALGHPSAMQCREIQFTLGVSGWSVIRLKMFCAGTDGSRSTNLLLALNGSIYWGLETDDGQMLQNQRQLMLPGGSVVVRLVIDEKQVELQLNGLSAQIFPIGPRSRAGSGLVIEPASLWGNPVNPISLTDFSATTSPGQVRVVDVNPEARTQVLTVPRFRQDDPPKNVLLAANGDVLRGEIEAATSTAFAFRSGLETLRIPRDRVEAAIWLQKPDATAPASDQYSAVLKLLDRRIDQRTGYGAVDLSVLIGVVRQLAPELKIKLPEKTDRRRFAMQFGGGETIAATLDRICALYGLSYRIDNTGTVVLESGTRPPRGQVRKVYWLKPAAFAGAAGSVQELLAARGIAFADGASAIWERDAGQLTVTNSPENQEKLAALIEHEFGGSLGSPNYWLLLADGSRLGLAVDKFDPDFIVGRHPVYGRCTVPVAEVCAINNSPPAPTAAMKSLEDWRLVFAPEPVLPESGGESSPLLGKDAPGFKIPLLDGGDFDLAQEKGHIVVLDFWATWCGPCIETLPGLIDTVAGFPADQVKLIGVDQSESPEQVKRFLQARGWKLNVALDAGQAVGRQYGADNIPHTVVIGQDGKVAWVKTGESPDGESETADAIKHLLAAPPSAPGENEPKPPAAPPPASPQKVPNWPWAKGTFDQLHL